jgi:hypothetical protein
LPLHSLLFSWWNLWGFPCHNLIGLTITSQLSAIFSLRIWRKYADRYSNKTIITISAPIYILVMVPWCFVVIYSALHAKLILLVFIHIVTGISTAGINLLYVHSNSIRRINGIFQGLWHLSLRLIQAV